MPAAYAPRPGARHAKTSPARGPWLAASVVISAAWVARLTGITTNYDIFIDEVTYTRIADNLATGHGLILYGLPFDLHPPAVFGLYALAIKAFGFSGSITSLVFDLRPLVAFFGAITCGVVFILVGNFAGWRAGLITAVILALDPFEIFYDSRVMLEAPAQLAAVITIYLLARSAYATSELRSWLLVGLTGLAAGSTLCAKEYFGLILAFTLVLCLMTGWITERRKIALALIMMCACYVLCESLVIASGGFHAWWEQFGSGLRRLIGLQQSTGFNSSAVHVSIISRITANASHFSTTYLILACGAPIAAIQTISIVRRLRWKRSLHFLECGPLLVALWALSATAYLSYATVFGTLEEQMYYLLLVPGICVITMWASNVVPKFSFRWRVVVGLLVGTILAVESGVWVVVHQHPDDEYRQLVAWATRHIPSKSIVAVTDNTAEFILSGVTIGQWSTVSALKAHHVGYVILSTTLVSQGYGFASQSFENYLQAHGTVAFRATGPSDGALIVYNVRAFTGAQR